MSQVSVVRPPKESMHRLYFDTDSLITHISTHYVNQRHIFGHKHGRIQLSLFSPALF